MIRRKSSPESFHRQRMLVQTDVIDSPVRVAGEIRVKHVTDDSDDGVPALAGHRLNSFAERIFVGPVLPRQLLVDHGDELRTRAIKIGEKTAPPKMDTKHLKVLRGHPA